MPNGVGNSQSVPLFADPLTWDSTESYDPLTIVYYQGNSYTSRQAVPAGTSIANTSYWALTGNYNAELQSIKPYVDNAIAEATAPPDMVVIGDSFTSDYYVTDVNLWYHAVADAIGCTPHNYSQRGAGYLNTSSVDSSTFLTLLNDAAEDTSFDNSNVKWLFVYGGLNDIEHADANLAFTTYFNNFCNAVISNFPNAQLVVCGINAWKDGFSFHSPSGSSQKNGQIYYEERMQSQDGFRNAHGIFISMCGALGFNADWYDTNNSHPNATGQKAIANWILSAMKGTSLVRSLYVDIKTLDTSITATGHLTLHLGAGMAEWIVWTQPQQANNSVMDALGFFKDGAIDARGCILCQTVSGQQQFGWLGGHVSNYEGVNMVNAGFGRGCRIW